LPDYKNTPEFTGERIVTVEGGTRVAVEHVHRYLTAKKIVQGLSVVDIGSGSGYGSQILSGFKDYVGVDIDTESVEIANNIYGSSNVRYVQGDATAIPLEGGIADVVVCFETLEHVHHPELIVKEAKRLLKPDGYFIFSTPDRDNYNAALFEANPFHVHEMTKLEILELFVDVFENVELSAQSITQSSLIRSSSFPSELVSEENVVAASKVTETPATYWVGIASDMELPQLPSTILPIIENRNIDAELVSTFIQLKQTENELEETRKALFAADEREINARQYIESLEIRLQHEG
jgi:SAM-dependent methyltransferase